MSAHLCPKCGENTIYFDGICRSCSQRQRREEILNLSADEVEAMILKIADRICEIEKWQEIYNDFWALFSLLGIHDPRIARAAAAKQIYYPPELYRGAPNDVRDALIAKLDSLQDNSKNALNHLLCSLAWQGDEKTAELFYELYQNPKPWRQKLYVGTEIYAQIGGWSFDRMGERKSLVFDKCLAVVRARDGAEKNGGCASERGDESASKISNFKGSADGENYEQNAQNGAAERLVEVSNLNTSTKSAATQQDEPKRRLNLDGFAADTARMAARGGLREHSDIDKNSEDVATAKQDEPKRRLNLNQNADEPVQIGRPTGQKCEFCGCEMLDMLRLKADEPRLAFLNLKHDAIFRCCPTCIGLVVYFCKIGADGEPQMQCEGEGMEKNYFSQQDLARLCDMRFELGGEVSPFYGCFSELDVTVGGYPQWVQDAAYLACPSCGGTMKHLAQIPFGEMIEGEGVIYVQICEKCEVLGGCFQCT